MAAFILVALSLLLSFALTAFADTTSAATQDRNRLFRCEGTEVQVADGESGATSGHAEAVLQVRRKVVHVNGAWPFTSDDLPIVSENDIEIKFSRFVNTSAFGDAGTFNKVTGKLRLDVTDGLGTEPMRVKVHWWGDYMCKATKKIL